MDVLKLNLKEHGAWSKETNSNGVGVVIRDSEGEVLGAYASKQTRCVDSFIVEAKAAVCALDFAQEMGLRNIILEGDRLTVIKKLQAREAAFSPIGILISEAKLRVSLFNSCNFNHVRRTNHEVAHLLTKYEIGISNELFWVEDVPNFIQNAIMYDRLN